MPGQFHIEQRLQASSPHDRPGQLLVRHDAAPGKFIIDDSIPAPGRRPIHPIELTGNGEQRRPLGSLHRHLPFQGDFKQDREPFVTQFPPILLKDPFENTHDLFLPHLPQQRRADRVLPFKIPKYGVRDLLQDVKGLEIGRGRLREPPVLR